MADPNAYPGAPAWVKAVVTVVLAGVLVLGALHLLGYVPVSHGP